MYIHPMSLDKKLVHIPWLQSWCRETTTPSTRAHNEFASIWLYIYVCMYIHPKSLNKTLVHKPWLQSWCRETTTPSTWVKNEFATTWQYSAYYSRGGATQARSASGSTSIQSTIMRWRRRILSSSGTMPKNTCKYIHIYIHIYIYISTYIYFFYIHWICLRKHTCTCSGFRRGVMKQPRPPPEWRTNSHSPVCAVPASVTVPWRDHDLRQQYTKAKARHLPHTVKNEFTFTCLCSAGFSHGALTRPRPPPAIHKS